MGPLHYERFENSMDNVKPALDTSGDEKLALWASNRVSIFVIFKLRGESGGSTPCVIDEFSQEILRLKWSLEPFAHTIP